MCESTEVKDAACGLTAADTVMKSLALAFYAACLTH